MGVFVDAQDKWVSLNLLFKSPFKILYAQGAIGYARPSSIYKSGTVERKTPSFSRYNPTDFRRHRSRCGRRTSPRFTVIDRALLLLWPEPRSMCQTVNWEATL